MSFFFTDGDLSGTLQFSEAEVEIATEFTVPPGGSAAFRWRTPSTLPLSTPTLKIWNLSGEQIATRSFDSALIGNAWAIAGAANRLSLPSGGTYRVSVNTNRYTAESGFFAGAVVRGDVTGVQAAFNSVGGNFPSTPSTASYWVDIDWQADEPDPEPEPEPTPGDEVVEEPRVGESLRLAKVMDEIALAVSAIAGLRMYGYPNADIRVGDAGAGYVTYPEQVLFNQTYSRGTAGYTGIRIALLTGNPWQKQARDRVARWADADGPSSVVARLEEWAWTTCDDLTVMDGRFEIETIAGIDYLALVLFADVDGSGRD